MLITMLYYLAMIPAAAVWLYPMKYRFLYPVRQVILRMAVPSLIMIPAGAFLHVRSGIEPDLIFYGMLVILFFSYRRNLDVHNSKSLSVFLWDSALTLILANFARGFDAVRNPSLGIETVTLDYALFFLTLHILEAAILFYPITKHGSILIDQLNLPRVWFLTIPFSLIFLVENILLRPRHYVTLYTNNIFLAFWTILAGSLLLWVLFTIIFYFIVTGILYASKTEERNHFLEMQEAQFRSQQKYMEESARARHDFRHVIRTLQELAHAEHFKELTDYLDKFAETLPENEFVRYCGNTPLNALLNYYVQSAAGQNITLGLKIDIPDKMPVSDVDLCGMVGNILENAITACLRLPEIERWIQLTVLTKNDAQLFIIATNSFDGKTRQKDGLYLSTNRHGTGMGLTSIKTTAEQYNGTAYFSHQDREFYTDIVIPLD